MKHIPYILLLGTAIVSAAVSCEKRSGSELTLPGRSLFAISTKSEGDTLAPEHGLTCRILTFNTDYTYDTVACYWYNTAYSVKYMEPCVLADDGSYVGPDTSDKPGMAGKNGSYLICYVSPGVKTNDDGTISFVPEDGPLYTTSGNLRSIGGYGIIKLDSIIVDRRARIGFKIFKNNNERIEDFYVSDFTLLGAADPGEKVAYNPAARQIDASMGTRPVQLIAKDKSLDDQTGYLSYYDSEILTIPSGIYAPAIRAADVLRTQGNPSAGKLLDRQYLYVTFNFTQGGRETIPLKVRLNYYFPELLAQNTYIIRITVFSNYLKLTMDVYDSVTNDWQGNFNDPNTFKTPTYTIELGEYRIDEWQKPGDNDELEEQIIG